MSLASLQTWLPAIAGALDFIHGQGYVHRDVKPDNILFDAQGHPHLGDFGIVKALEGGQPARPGTVLTQAGTVVGTPQYLAPELALGQSYDGRADQYALAVTVYELLAARYPYDGTTPAAIALLHARQAAPPLNALVPSAPPAMVAALQRALSTLAAQRFPDCASFASALLGRGPAGAVTPAREPAPAQTTVACPHCRKEVLLPSALLGKQVRCPACRRAYPSSPGKPARPVREPAAPPRKPAAAPVGALGRALSRLCVGAALGAGVGYLLDYLLARPPASGIGTWPGFRPEGQALVLVTWARLGALSGGAAWFAEGRAGRRSAAWLVVWVAGGLLLGLLGGIAGHQAGTRTAGPLSPLYGMSALLAGLGLVSGWLQGGNFLGGLAGAAAAAVGGEALAAALLGMARWETSSPLLHFLLLATVLGALWFVAFPLLRKSPGEVLLLALLIGAAVPLLLWRTLADTGELRVFEGHTGPVTCLALGPDGRQFLSAGPGDDALRLWDVEGGKEEQRLRGRKGAPRALAFSSDGRSALLASEDGKFRAWGLTADKQPGAHELAPFGLGAAAFAGDGKRLLCGNTEGELLTWGLREQRLVGQPSKESKTAEPGAVPPPLARLKGHERTIVGLALSFDGRLAVSASEDGTVRLWDVAHEKESGRLQGRLADVSSVACTLDGQRVATGHRNGTIRVWERATGRETKRLQEHKGAVRCLAFSSKGERLLSGGQDGTVRLWEAANEQELRRFTLHRDAILAVAFARDDRRALSASADGTVRLWRLTHGLALGW